jgi:MFS family permease
MSHVRIGLGATPETASFIASLATLTMAAAVLGAGTLGDLYGMRRMFVVGLIGTVAFSLLAAVSPTSAVLTAARAGVGVALAFLLGAYWLSLSNQISRAGRGCDTLRDKLALRFSPVEPSAREPEYVKIAQIVNGWFGSKRPVTIGCTEIGVFGYYYRGPLLDVYGLISPKALEVLKPEVLEKLPPESREFPYAALMTYKPEMFLTWPMFVPPAPPQFKALYQRLNMKFGVALYVRRDMIGQIAIPPEMLKVKNETAPGGGMETNGFGLL